MSKTLQLASDLIRKPSVTPEDEGCQQLIAERLAPLGFSCEWMPFEEVTNVWLRRGDEDPLFVMAGHTDVVPPGPEEKWLHPPFEPTVDQEILYGRGAVDMKGGLAAMVVAVENFITKYPDHKGSIAFLLTSDEEGPSINGTAKVVETLKKRQEIPKWCIIGEPSSTKFVGDVVKIGRRGSLSGHLRIHGQQGHVAYPHLAINPIHHALQSLQTLLAEVWDMGNEYFPPTTFQFVDIKSGANASNVIPSTLDAHFNFRFCTEVTASELITRVEDLLKKHDISFDIDWTRVGEPFLTPYGLLQQAAEKVIYEVNGYMPELSTTGGTSDGRFIATMDNIGVIELGLNNETIHQINECTPIKDLENLTHIYEKMLYQLLI